MDKLVKKVAADRALREKRTTCQKYVRMVLDISLVATAIGQELQEKLDSDKTELSWTVRALPERECIIWERSIGQHTLTTSSNAADKVLSLDDQWQAEKELVRILTVAQLKEATRTATLERMVNDLRDTFPEKRCTLLILGKRQQLAAHSKTLIELQVLHRINVLQIPPNAQDWLEELQRFTKAIAEAPYKQKEAALLSGFKKYVANDNKECVKVEGTNGYGRLWQQHLNRLPLVTLEVAETVIGQYACPKKLLDEYASNPNAVREMADLKIRRGGAAAQLLNERRLGNVLSEKIYTLYTTRDPQALL